MNKIPHLEKEIMHNFTENTNLPKVERLISKRLLEIETKTKKITFRNNLNMTKMSGWINYTKN